MAAGGTGTISFAVDSLIASGSSATSALTTRGIVNNTTNTAAVGNTNIPTMNTLYYTLATINGLSQSRETNLIAATTTAPGANAILYASGTGTNSALVWQASGNGALFSTGTNSSLSFGTLPIAQGGTGKTSAAEAWAALGGGTAGTESIGYFATAGHAHGNLDNNGKISGNTASGYAVSTTTNGALVAETLAVAEAANSTTTATQFISTLSQKSNGQIVFTKRTFPSASTTTAGIIKIGTTANDAAAGNHTHSDYALSTHTHSDYSTGVTIRIWS